MAQVNSSSFYANYASSFDMTQDQILRVTEKHETELTLRDVCDLSRLINWAAKYDDSQVCATSAEGDMKEITKHVDSLLQKELQFIDHTDSPSAERLLYLTKTELAAVGQVIEMLLDPDEYCIELSEVGDILGTTENEIISIARHLSSIFPTIYCNDYSNPDSFDKLQDWLQ